MFVIFLFNIFYSSLYQSLLYYEKSGIFNVSLLHIGGHDFLFVLKQVVAEYF
jgi:hypothetical protein